MEPEILNRACSVKPTRCSIATGSLISESYPISILVKGMELIGNFIGFLLLGLRRFGVDKIALGTNCPLDIVMKPRNEWTTRLVLHADGRMRLPHPGWEPQILRLRISR